MGVKYFDIHIVANQLPTQLLEQLLSLGYTQQTVIGGDHRVRMQNLLSQKSIDKKTADSIFNHSVSAIECYPEFNGYIEEEAITEDYLISNSNSRTSIDKPFDTIPVSSCPPGKYKGCDIHATTLQTQQKIMKTLVDSGFYYLSLDKPQLGKVNVLTIQLEDVAQGKQVWQTLVSYLRESSSFDGFVKFEVTVNIKNFGFCLPPIVLKETMAKNFS